MGLAQLGLSLTSGYLSCVTLGKLNFYEDEFLHLNQESSYKQHMKL